MPNLSKHPLEIARQWSREGRSVALATVLQTWGSSPRPAGSQLVVSASGEFAGSVSAGCVESSVIAKSAEVLRHGRPEILDLGIDDGMAWEVGLSCGGQISILVERLDPQGSHLDDLIEARRHGRPAVVATDLESGERRLFVPETSVAPNDADDPVERAALAALAANRCSREKVGSRHLFLHSYRRAPRLLVVGAVHIAESLLVMARAAGFDEVLIEPRQSFAEREPFVDVPLLRQWPAEAFENLGLDSDTAVVTLTHDPKIDDPALELALQSPAFYVGALGSRRTQERRRQRLRERGLPESTLDALHGPVGLAIGAVSPAEIAVSILAEVIAERRCQSDATADLRSGSDNDTPTPSSAAPT